MKLELRSLKKKNLTGSAARDGAIVGKRSLRFDRVDALRVVEEGATLGG